MGDALPRLETFTLSDLMNDPEREVGWIIEDLLPPGLTVLAGAPKIGKSWLALDIALSVTRGLSVFGDKATKQGPVLYLALEDSRDRLGRRARKMIDEDPAVSANLTFATRVLPMASGGLRQLEDWLNESRAYGEEPALVIVDTFAKFAPRDRAEGYNADYAVTGKLHELAHQHRIALLVIHHLRKAKAQDGDVFDEISGTQGLSGAVDTRWVLKRSKTENTGMLYADGRDVDDCAIAAEFDKETYRWNLTGDLREPERRKQLTALKAAFGNGPFTNETARLPLGVSLAQSKRIIGDLVAGGYIIRLQENAGKAHQFQLTDKFDERVIARASCA